MCHTSMTQAGEWSAEWGWMGMLIFNVQCVLVTWTGNICTTLSHLHHFHHADNSILSSRFTTMIDSHPDVNVMLLFRLWHCSLV